MQQSRSSTYNLWGLPLNSFWLFCIFLVLSVLLFLPTLSKPFLCDDYLVVHRVVVEKTIFINGFFRPLSDIAIYACWWLAGLNPVFYNVFNLLVHAGSCVVLFRFCQLVPLFRQQEKGFIAVIASLFFLVYPFHNESVVWMVGRASGLAAFFGFISMLVVFSNLSLQWKYFLAPLFYFIGLAGYETIFPLPAIVLLFLYERNKPLRSYFPWIILYGLALLLHLLVRYLLSGAIFGTYGEKIFTPSSGYLSNAFKVMGRLLLPPSHHSQLLAILFVTMALLFAAALFFIWKKRKHRWPVFSMLAMALVISCVIPIMFGLSTRTSEGDRLLYFASFFLVLLMAYGLASLQNRMMRHLLAAATIVYFIIYLAIGNQHWSTAGNITEEIIAFVKKEKLPGQQMGLINLPQEYEGALVFRNGFPEALLLHGVDTSGITVLRTLTTEEAREINTEIRINEDSAATFVPPNTLIRADATIVAVQPVSLDTAFYNGKKFSMLYYWNKYRMVKLAR